MLHLVGGQTTPAESFPVPDTKSSVLLLFFIIVLLLPGVSLAQKDTTKVPDGTEGVFHTVIPEGDSGEIKTKKLPANEFEGAYSTFKVGLGYIHDLTTHIQSDEFKEQMDSANLDVETKLKLRDFRILVSGRLKTKRSISWKGAYMWDGDKNVWMLRESGITIGVPELAGHIFIGRTKEGYSMVKVMNGHSPWTQERQMALDPIPILADGIKWFGYLPKSRVFWNLGAFHDWTSKGQSFSTFEWQYVARVGWLPYYQKEQNKVLHVAANFRIGKPLNGKITLKSRPESNPTPQILNTGEFQTDNSHHMGGEIYYSTGRLLLGSEMMVHKFSSDKSDNHSFFGGDVVATYFFTGTKRPYNTVGSIFGFVPVRKSVFKGGWGEWEGVLRFSTFNLNDGTIQGGQFWRLTPMVNWYITRILRMEFVYGYGVLDRFNKKGSVQFFESRIQVTIM